MRNEKFMFVFSVRCVKLQHGNYHIKQNINYEVNTTALLLSFISLSSYYKQHLSLSHFHCEDTFIKTLFYAPFIVTLTTFNLHLSSYIMCICINKQRSIHPVYYYNDYQGGIVCVCCVYKTTTSFGREKHT